MPPAGWKSAEPVEGAVAFRVEVAGNENFGASPDPPNENSFGSAAAPEKVSPCEGLNKVVGAVVAPPKGDANRGALF